MKEKFDAGAKKMLTYGTVMAHLNESSTYVSSGGFAAYSQALEDRLTNERVSGFLFTDTGTGVRLEALLQALGIKFVTWFSDLKGSGELHIDPAHQARADKLFGGWQSNVVVSMDPRNAAALQKWKEYV